MLYLNHQFTQRTNGPGLYEITEAVTQWVTRQGRRDGLLTVFLPHTSASLLIQENADPDVRRDLHAFFERIVPESASLYRHRAEGADDMPAHIKAALTTVQFSVPVSAGVLGLGTWQGLYLFEHRQTPQQRLVSLTLMGP